MSTVGTRIKTARETLGLSQVAVADYVGVAQKTVSNWERDEIPPRLDEAAALCVFLGLSWSDFDPHRIAS